MIINALEEKSIDIPDKWKNKCEDLNDFLQQNWDQRFIFYQDKNDKSKQQFLGIGEQQKIRTNNYIGTICYKEIRLNIFPKVFETDCDNIALDFKHLMLNLVQWIEYCNKVEYPYINITGEFDDSTDLRELFISLYLRYVKYALDRGMYHQYEDITEDGAFIKGKINLKNYLIRKYPAGLWNRFQCTYSVFESDNLFNKIIKYTCKKISDSTSEKNCEIIKDILAKLSGVSDIPRCLPEDCDKIRLNKVHSYYKIILSMSKMFLLNQTVNQTGDNEAFCFLFPTELLFEGFISGFLESILKGKPMTKIELQSCKEYVFNNVMYAGESKGKSMQMRPDILVEHNNKLFILDTKYKKIKRIAGNPELRTYFGNNISQSDIYQVLTYARTKRQQDVYLLYPLSRFEDPEPYELIGINDPGEGVLPINVHVIRLPFVFEENIEQTKQQLIKALQDIIE